MATNDTQPRIRICVNCDVPLGQVFSRVPGRGYMCEVCADHVRQAYHRQERRERDWWSSWLSTLMGRWP